MPRAEFPPSEELEVSGESGKHRYVLTARICTAVFFHQFFHGSVKSQKKLKVFFRGLVYQPFGKNEVFADSSGSFLCPCFLAALQLSCLLLFGHLSVLLPHGALPNLKS